MKAEMTRKDLKSVTSITQHIHDLPIWVWCPSTFPPQHQVATNGYPWTNLIRRWRSCGSRDWEGMSPVLTIVLVHFACRLLSVYEDLWCSKQRNSKRPLLPLAQPPCQWLNVCHFSIHNFLRIWWIIWDRRYLWYELMTGHMELRVMDCGQF